MTKKIATRMENIAEKYSELVEKRLETAIKSNDTSTTEMLEINEGIRMIAYAATTILKINQLNRGNGTAD